MKIIKQEKGEDINVQIFPDKSVVIHQSNDATINDMISIYPSSVVKVFKELSEHESVTSDFLLDLRHWLMWKDNPVFDKTKGSWIDEKEYDRLTKQFGESDG